MTSTASPIVIARHCSSGGAGRTLGRIAITGTVATPVVMPVVTGGGVARAAA